MCNLLPTHKMSAAANLQQLLGTAPHGTSFQVVVFTQPEAPALFFVGEEYVLWIMISQINCICYFSIFLICHL